jgi:cytidine deaminase
LVAEPELSPSIRELVALAEKVRENAYARYSGFAVGAALRTRAGAVYVGCHVENASYGATSCAERSAIAAMVSAGEREVESIAVFTDANTASMPCGICRQVLLEFGRPDTAIVAASPRGVALTSLAELLPRPFVLEP